MVDRRIAEAGDALEVARHLFPAARMDQIESGTIVPEFFTRPGFRLRLTSVPTVPRTGLCAREWALYDLDRPEPYPDTRDDLLIAVNEERRRGIAIAHDGSCASEDGYVRHRDGLDGEATEQQLLWLADLVRAARDGGDLHTEVHCRSDGAGRCDNVRDAVASLPLNRLRAFSVSGPARTVTSDSGREMRFATRVADTGHVNVRAIFNYDGGPTLSAWQVTWRVREGEISTVRLWRAGVIYH